MEPWPYGNTKPSFCFHTPNKLQLRQKQVATWHLTWLRLVWNSLILFMVAAVDSEPLRSKQLRTEDCKEQKTLIAVGPQHSSKHGHTWHCISFVTPLPSNELNEEIVNWRLQILPMPMTGVPSPCNAKDTILFRKSGVELSTGCPSNAGCWACNCQDPWSLSSLSKMIFCHAAL